MVDKANEWLAQQRWQPSMRTLPPYHDDPLYIDALAADIQRQLDGLDFAPELLLLSFHGMPARTLELGDPYHCHCQKTARLLEAKLGQSGQAPELRFRTSFQSRFGPAKWLEPATDAVLAEEAAAGTKRRPAKKRKTRAWGEPPPARRSERICCYHLAAPATCCTPLASSSLTALLSPPNPESPQVITAPLLSMSMAMPRSTR